MRRIVIPRRVIHFALYIAAGVVIALLILVVIQQGRTLNAVERETNRATSVERQIVQDTVNRISRAARAERLEACRNDEQVRTAARIILIRFDIPLPDVFNPRNCVQVADDYARALRDAGPLSPEVP